MKKLLTLIFVSLTLTAISQSKGEFGITTEGSWFLPASTMNNTEPNKNGFSTGIGVYASHRIYNGLSADIGLSYRYANMQQHYTIYYEHIEFPIPIYQPNIKSTGWDKFKMNYLVVPVHIQLLLTKSYFVRGGIEAAWLTNYSVVNEKPEFNWTAGIGSQKHKLKWSVNYIQGFKDQGFGNRVIEADGHNKAAIYRNNMIQLSLSYPLWLLK